MPDANVREARLSDADAMGRVHVRAWQVGYEGQMPAAYLGAMSVEASALRWRSYFDLPVQRRVSTALVAVDDVGEVTAIASYGQARGDPGVGELCMLNADPDRWREGWGRRLIDDVVARLAADGFRDAMLWVVGTNDRARRFYESMGWQPDGGSKVEDIGGDLVEEVRYRRTLT